MSFIDIFKSEQFKGEIENLKAQNSKYKKQVENVDRYFKEIMKLIQFNTKVSLDAFLFSKEDTKTYLDYKNKIQEDINSLFRRENDKKIVIIIDDFDRIDESKQDVILNFIKEVIDFKCCTTIFAVDFNNLLHNKKIDFGYMEKFIDIKFDLCQLDFKDILEYHMEEIFEDITFENEKSKEILNEIKSNVFSYYKNIENRMVTWETNREESSKKQGEDEKQRYDNETLEIVSYSRNKLSNNNNSRRGIHFLNSIKNTILLVDELYPNYNYGIELLNSINCAEIIYFFTYIKIFNPNIYLGIVNESGVEEYRSYLKAEINKKIKDENQEECISIKLRLQYFDIIIGDLITKPTMYFEDEKRTLKRENELDFIKDIFIDYNFTVNNIELITKSEKVLNELDKNSLNLSNIKFNELELIQKAINRNEGRSTKAITSIRIERLMKCAIEECKNNIKVRQLINLAVNKKHYRNVENIKWYLDPIVNALKCKKIELDMRDEQFIKSELFYLEMDNINRYKWILQSYLLLLNCRKKQLYEDDIKETLNNVNTKEELITKIVKYLKRHSYFKEDKVISTLDELFSCIDLLINKDKLDIIDFSILENNFNEFKSNQELIEAIKEFPTINSNNIKDEYQLPKDELKNIIKDIHDITNRLKKLSSEQLSDYDEIMYFRRIIIIINEKYYDKVSKEIEELSLSIFRSIDKDNCYDDDLYIYIAINIQIIKDNVNNQKAYTPNDSR